VLCRRRVPGSRWASNAGCDSDVEREAEDGPEGTITMACGMGHVPEESQRFLDFLSQQARWRS
jgi:hypothetical protein